MLAVHRDVLVRTRLGAAAERLGGGSRVSSRHDHGAAIAARDRFGGRWERPLVHRRKDGAHPRMARWSTLADAIPRSERPRFNQQRARSAWSGLSPAFRLQSFLFCFL